jgi:hypothetical protein
MYPIRVVTLVCVSLPNVGIPGDAQDTTFLNTVNDETSLTHPSVLSTMAGHGNYPCR